MRILAHLLSLAALPALALSSVPARAASQPYAISHFSGIRVVAPIRVIVVASGGVSARAEGDRDLLDRLDLSISGDTLTVRMGAPGMGETGSNPGGVTLRVTTDQLSRITLAGAGTVEVDRMKGLNGTVNVYGGGTVTVGQVATDRLSVGIAGDGGATLSGSTLTASIDIVGAGSLNGEGLSVGRLAVGSRGSGSVTARARDTATVTATGAGAVTIYGKPSCKVTHAGTGRVVCADRDY